MSEKLVEVKELRKWFPIKKGFLKRTVGHVKAVDGLNSFIYKGETLGVVGGMRRGCLCTGCIGARTDHKFALSTKGKIFADIYFYCP